MKVKDYTIRTLESAQFSACDNFSWETWKKQVGRQGRQGLGKTHHPTKGNKKGGKGRQDLGMAETPSNTGTHAGRPSEKIRDKVGKTIGNFWSQQQSGVGSARNVVGGCCGVCLGLVKGTLFQVGLKPVYKLCLCSACLA